MSNKCASNKIYRFILRTSKECKDMSEYIVLEAQSMVRYGMHGHWKNRTLEFNKQLDKLLLLESRLRLSQIGKITYGFHKAVVKMGMNSFAQTTASSTHSLHICTNQKKKN